MDIIHVLIVDDDPDILELYSAALSSQGLTVDTAVDAYEALGRLQKYHPELVISDIQMPGMDGYDLCRRVRDLGMKEIPFFFCSALSAIPQRIEGLRLGADDYLVKPVDLEELVLKVKLQLGRNQRLREARKGASAEDESVRGQLEDLEVYQVLQLVPQLGRRNLKITVRPSSGHEGEIWVMDGELVDARLGPFIGKKALLRILDTTRGTFTMEPLLWLGDEKSLSGSPDHMILAMMTELDEYRLLRQKADDAGGWFSVIFSKNLFGQWIDEIPVTILGLVEEHHEVQAILDASPLPDSMTLRILAEFQHLDRVKVSTPPEGE